MIENYMVINYETIAYKCIFKCDYCECEIYEGDNYYNIKNENCCEDCLNENFRFEATRN